ncbi:hypothetical protein JCM6882_001167 [Rhodosporidiobolus microsporus]
MPPRASTSGGAPKPNKYHTAAVQERLLLADAPIPPPLKLSRADGAPLRFQKMSGVRRTGQNVPLGWNGAEGGVPAQGQGQGGAGEAAEGSALGEAQGLTTAGGALPYPPGQGPSPLQSPALGVPTMENVLESGRAGSEEMGALLGEEDEDDDDSDDEGGKKKQPQKRNASSTGRKRITISYIEDKVKRSVTFTKRKSGLMKKAYELSTLTGTNVAVVIVSESGNIFTFCTPSLSGVTDHPKGREIIAQSLSGELRASGAVGDDGTGGEAKGKGKGKRAASATSAGGGKGTPPVQIAPAPPTPAIDPSLPTPPLAMATGVHSHFPTYDLPFPPPHSPYGPAPPHSAAGGGDELPTPPSVFGSHHPHSHHQLHPHPLHPLLPHPHSHPHGLPHVPAPSAADFLPRPPLPPAPTSTTSPAAPAAPLAAHYPPHAIPLPLLPAPAPSSSSSSSQPQPQPQPQPAHIHAPHLPPTTDALSTYALARLNHQQAFESYQAQVGGYDRVPGLSGAATATAAAGAAATGAGAGPSASRSAAGGGADGAEADPLKRKASDESAAAGNGQEGVETQPGGGGEGGQMDPAERERAGREERTRGWRGKAEEAVEEAKKLRTLPLTFRAHSYALLAAHPDPPALPPVDPSRAYSVLGEDADEQTQMFASFERMCAKAGVEGEAEEEIEGAMGEFLGRWLPHELSILPPDFRSQALASARGHLLSFVDFLEAHGLVSPALHQRLAFPSSNKKKRAKAGQAQEEEGFVGLAEERRARLYGQEGGVGGDAAVGGTEGGVVEEKEELAVQEPAVTEEAEKEPDAAPPSEGGGERRSKRRRK